MIVDDNTTLKELRTIRDICIQQHEKSKGIKEYPCSGCGYGYFLKADNNVNEDGFYLPSYKLKCEGGQVNPCDWVLPVID